MAVEAVLFDQSTLLSPKDHTVWPGVLEMLADLKAMGLRWVATSNEPSSTIGPRLQRAGLTPDALMTRSETGDRKPSPKFCNLAAQQLGLKNNQLVYVGDDDRNDAIAAIAARVLYFNARWAHPAAPPYGFDLAAPASVPAFLRLFLRRQPRWHLQLDEKDGDGNPVSTKALLSARREWNAEITNAIKGVLKRGGQNRIGPVRVDDLLLFHLLTTIYLGGLHEDVDWWTVYPSSTAGKVNDILVRFSDQYSKLFRDRFLPDLLVRHTNAETSHKVRAQGRDPGFINQANTLHLNPAHRGNIRKKHVLVLDDFTTDGYSLEAARLLLLRGGARAVTGIGIGAHYSSLKIQTPAPGLMWDPWSARQFDAKDFRSRRVDCQVDQQALKDFESLIDEMRKWKSAPKGLTPPAP
ncbi:MAG TPA: HAD-IA family hydrolase [Gemmatimonadales bacterium]|nr:HAD-IA family hydrolase [Gemmatimonadales bacterium]